MAPVERRTPPEPTEAELVLLLTRLEAAGWFVWLEVTDTGSLLAMVRSPVVDIVLP